jgi:hypothetical protein
VRIPPRVSLLGSWIFVLSLVGCAPVDPGEPAPLAAAPAPSPPPGPAPAGPSTAVPPGSSTPDSGWKNLVRGSVKLGPVDFSDRGAAGAGGSDPGADGQDQGAGAAGQDPEKAPAGSAGSDGGHEEAPGGAGGSTPEDSGDHGDAGQAGQAPEEQPAAPECEEGQIQGCFSAGYLAVCQAGGYWGGQACPAEAPLCFQGTCWASLPSDPPAEPTP